MSVFSMIAAFIIGVCMCVTLSQQQQQQHVTVQTKVGTIIGFVSSAEVDGQQLTLHKFLGVPYAESTAGDRRFRKPVPKAPFTGPFMATEFGDVCFQVESDYARTGNSKFSEDCLMLNIFVPVTSSQPSDLPVMVYIHGGGFFLGSSNTYVPSTLSAFGQVISVTLNYRLGPLGYLSTEDQNSLGNYGLWDQHLALKWVQENIQAFGGNKDMVTIFGQSAGSASVVYQALYPGNKRLFHRAIAQSGSITSTWAKPDNPRQKALQVVKDVGCYLSDWPSRMRCMRDKPIIAFNDSINSQDWTKPEMIPVLDGEFITPDAFGILNGSDRFGAVRDMFSSVDLIIGSNNLDDIAGTTRWLHALNSSDINTLHVSKDVFVDDIAPLYVKDSLGIKQSTNILNHALSMVYTDWSNPDDDAIRRTSLLYLSSDVVFTIPALQAARAHSRYSNKTSYVYEFDATPASKTPSLPTWAETENMAYHAAEVGYVFGFDPEMVIFQPTQNLTSKQKIVEKVMMTMWTNFAKSGNPNLPTDLTRLLHTTWPPYNEHTQKALIISTNLGPESVVDSYKAEKFQFWTEFLPLLHRGLANCPVSPINITSPPDPVLVG